MDPVGESLIQGVARADHVRMVESTMLRSRAVERMIQAGNTATCVNCGQPVKFVAKAQLRQVIANVYVGGVWDRVEHYHAECYQQVGEPYGAAAA